MSTRERRERRVRETSLWALCTLFGSLYLWMVSVCIDNGSGLCVGIGLPSKSLQNCEYLLLSASFSITTSNLLPCVETAATKETKPSSRPSSGNLMVKKSVMDVKERSPERRPHMDCFGEATWSARASDYISHPISHSNAEVERLRG